jgi:hypothetical protein
MLKPVLRFEWINARYKTDMATLAGQLQCDGGAEFAFNRECFSRKKRIICRLDNQGRGANVFQELFAAGLCVVIINITKAMQRRRDPVIKLSEPRC